MIHLNIKDSTLIDRIIGNTFIYGGHEDGTTILIPIDKNMNFEVNESYFSLFNLRIQNRFEKIDTCGKFTFHFRGYPEIDLLNVLFDGNDTLISFDYPLKCVSAIEQCNNVCPKCNKSDNVQSVRYGLPLENPLTGEIESEYYYPYCDYIHCGGNWYCERDNILF